MRGSGCNSLGIGKVLLKESHRNRVMTQGLLEECQSLDTRVFIFGRIDALGTGSVSEQNSPPTFGTVVWDTSRMAGRSGAILSSPCLTDGIVNRHET